MLLGSHSFVSGTDRYLQDLLGWEYIICSFLIICWSWSIVSYRILHVNKKLPPHWIASLLQRSTLAACRPSCRSAPSWTLIWVTDSCCWALLRPRIYIESSNLTCSRWVRVHYCIIKALRIAAHPILEGGIETELSSPDYIIWSMLVQMSIILMTFTYRNGSPTLLPSTFSPWRSAGVFPPYDTHTYSHNQYCCFVFSLLIDDCRCSFHVHRFSHRSRLLIWVQPLTHSCQIQRQWLRQH